MSDLPSSALSVLCGALPLFIVMNLLFEDAPSQVLAITQILLSSEKPTASQNNENIS